MPRREPTQASVRAATTLFMIQGNALDAAQANDTIASRYYNSVMEMMPLGFRGSFLKFIGFPASWATAYGLSPAQVSQDRYSADVMRIWRGVRPGDISAEQKLALTTLLIRSYIIAAPSVMDMSVFPDFRRPRWMTAQQREFLVLSVSGAYSQRAELVAFGTLAGRGEEPAMSREEALRAGAEPTAAEQMAVEMGGEGAPEEEIGEEEVDEIREQIEMPEMRTVGSGNTTTQVIPDAYVKRLVNLQDGERGARAVVDIINDDLRDPAAEALIILERKVRNDLVVRWPEGTTSERLVRNTAAVVYKFREDVVGMPNVIMVIAKMICPEEDVNICPLATARVSEESSDSTAAYAYRKVFDNRYWNAGFRVNEAAYGASMYRVVVYKLAGQAVGVAERSISDSQMTLWLARYNTYLRSALALQANLPEEAPTFAGTDTAEQAGASEADVQLQREIREQITLPRGIDSPMDNAVYSAIYILIKLGYDRSDVRFAVRSLIANYNLVPIVVEPPQSAQERRLYSETRVPFLRLGLIEAQMGDGMAFNSARATYYARTISDSPAATEWLSSQYRLQRFTNTRRGRTRPLQGVLGVPLPASNSGLSVDQLGAEILRLREQSLATASRMTGVEPTAAETTTATQEAPTSMQIPDLSDALRNRMRRGGPEYKIVAFQVGPSHGALYGESHRLRTEVPAVRGDARNNMNYIFYLATPNVGMEGYRAVEFWQLSFGQIPYDIAEGGKVTNMTFVRRILNFLNESGRQEPGTVRLDEPPLEAKRELRKFLADPSRFVFFSPTYRGVSDNILHTNVSSAEITATSETLQTMMSQLFTMVRDRNMGEASSRQQQASSGESSRLTITANPRDEGVEQNDELTSGSSATEQDAAARPVTSFAAVRNKKIDRTFAYEIEGDMTMAADTDPTSLYEALRKGVRNAGTELNAPTDRLKLYTSTSDTFKKFNEYSIKGDGSVAGARPFETDSRLFVPPRVDVGTTTANDMLTPEQFNKLKYSKVEDMWRDINTMSTAMLKAGVRIHKSAGLHIHMSTSDFSDEEMRNYIKNYIKLEPLLDLMMPINSRQGGRSYNGSISIAGQIRTGWQKGNTTPNPLPERWIRHPRQNLRNKIRTETGISTIEFRHPMTNIEGDLIKHFVLLHYHLCEAAKVGVLPDGKFKTLETILPVETSTFLFNRIEDLDQPKLRTEAEENRFFTGTRGQDTALKKNNLM